MIHATSPLFFLPRHGRISNAARGHTNPVKGSGAHRKMTW